MSEPEPARPPWARWEWAALAATAVALVAYAAWPMARARAMAPEGAEFLGVLVGVRDAHFYLSQVRQEVGWLPVPRDAFGAAGRDQLFSGMFWWALAQVRRGTGASPFAVYHGARYAGAVACVLAIAAFATVCARGRRERWLAIELAVWGSGFGWLVARFGWHGGQSADLLTSEISTAYTVLSFPHITWALALLVAGGAAVVRAGEGGRPWPWGGVAGACAFLLGWFHPFNLIVLLGAWGLYLAVVAARNRGAGVALWRATWPLAVGGLLPVGYFLGVMWLYPWGLPHSTIPRPAYGDLALGFGFLGGGALAYGFGRVRYGWPGGAGAAWCAAWVAATLVLLHGAPLLRHAGRVILGLQVPLAMWTAAVLARGIANLPGPARPIVAGLGLLACMPTTGTVVRQRLARLEWYPSRYYHLTPEAVGMADLGALVSPEDRIACSPWNGLVLSARVPARVFVGRWDVPNYDARVATVQQLFAAETPADVRRALVERHGITVLYIAEAERGAFPEAGLRAAVRELGAEVLVRQGTMLAVRVAPPPL